jgi:hypothetical protein
MVHRDHRVVVAPEDVVKERVCRRRTVGIESSSPCLGDRWGHHGDFFASEVTAFSGMGIEPANPHALAGQAQ